MLIGRVENFEPEDLAELGSMFDESWAAVEPAFEHADEVTRASARTRLAALLLQLAGHESNRESIRRTVLHIFLQAPTLTRAPSSR
jgi:hypothetical protein